MNFIKKKNIYIMKVRWICRTNSKLYVTQIFTSANAWGLDILHDTCLVLSFPFSSFLSHRVSISPILLALPCSLIPSPLPLRISYPPSGILSILSRVIVVTCAKLSAGEGQRLITWTRMTRRRVSDLALPFVVLKERNPFSSRLALCSESLLLVPKWAH